MLSKKEKKEFLELSRSSRFREDMENVSRNRHNPFIVNGNIDIDKYIMFLDGYNDFVNHSPREFRRIIDKDMRL